MQIARILSAAVLLGAGLALAGAAQAALYIDESFQHPDGNLTDTVPFRTPIPGPGGVWAIHSGLATEKPIQVSSGAVTLQQSAGSGQDVNSALGYIQAAGETLYAAFDLTVTGTTPVTSTYFAHFKNNVTGFASRVFVTPNGTTGFKMGLSASGSSAGATWGETLALGSTYRIVHSYSYSTGEARLWVDPTEVASTSIANTGTASVASQAYALRQSTGNSSQVIDNLKVASTFAEVLGGTSGGGDTAPMVAGTSPANGAVDVAVDSAILVSFSEPVTLGSGAFALSCGGLAKGFAVSTSNDTAYTLTPTADLPFGASCAVTVTASLVTDQDNPPDQMAADYSFGFGTEAALAGCGTGGETLISAIQGSGITSPLNGQTHTVEAVVVADFQPTDGNGLSGFFIQEEDTQVDGDPATSEGLFVYDPANTAAVSTGQVVRVTGSVAEFKRSSDTTGNTLTQMGSVTQLQVCTELSGTASPALVTLPLASDPTTDLEPVEGMLVSLEGAPDAPLTLAEYFNLDRFGEIRVAAGGRPYQFTHDFAPDVAGYTAHVADLARITLLIDDGRSAQNLYPVFFGRGGLPLNVAGTENLLRGGDTVASIAGAMHYDFGVYRLQPTLSPNFVAGNERPASAPALSGRLKVASYNVLNYFQQLDDGTAKCGPAGALQECRGANQGLIDSQGRNERDRQEAKLVPALLKLDADIYGLIELENDFGNGGVTSAARLAQLMDDYNDAHDVTDCTDYEALAPGVYVGGDAIAPGMIFCTDSVQLAPGTHIAILDDVVLAGLPGGVPAGVTLPVFNGDSTNRTPLAATFREIATGSAFTLVVNHFKSKGASALGGKCASPVDLNCDQGDGQGYWSQRRLDAAEAVIAWLATGPTGSADPDVLLVGDLNSYAKEDSIDFLESQGYENLVASFGGADAYSYLFDAQLGYLDYALASPSLQGQVRGAAEWHINTDEPDALDYDISFNNENLFAEDEFRTSDHDPVLVGLELVVRGDLSGSGRVTWNQDRPLFMAALGSQTGQAKYRADADLDGDGRVTLVDYRSWWNLWVAGGRVMSE